MLIKKLPTKIIIKIYLSVLVSELLFVLLCIAIKLLHLSVYYSFSYFTLFQPDWTKKDSQFNSHKSIN